MESWMDLQPGLSLQERWKMKNLYAVKVETRRGNERKEGKKEIISWEPVFAGR